MCYCCSGIVECCGAPEQFDEPCARPTTSTTPAATTTSSTTPPPTTTSTTPTPTTTPIPTLIPTNASANATVVVGRRQVMSEAAVQKMAEQVTVLVSSAVAASAAASMAGAASGPGALSVIGQVQMLSQVGKVGGGGGALAAFSDSFGWANAELPFQLVPVGDVPSASGEARRSFRKKLDPPKAGETHEQQDPKCRKADLSEEEKSECRKCGMINGVTLLDKLIVVIGSFVVVFFLRWFLQFFITRCLKKEPWDALVFPNWEGPLLLAHWFGMCESLTKTIGRPCPLWYGLSSAILFAGPILFLIYAVFSIRRHIAKGEIVFEVHEKKTWGQARAEMRKTKGCFGKLTALHGWCVDTRVECK